MRLCLYTFIFLCSTYAYAEEDKDYLYYRDVSISPYQNLREFFDMPDRIGSYQLALVSDSVGPLTFTVSRVRDDVEILVKQTRSYSVGNHEFHFNFDNPTGLDDLLVEIANSNPVLPATLYVIVVEQPK